ncbi:hypothetical protein BC833DRAFT_590777 [Globomyces pollinis-pini]|nr:hypothetical protein BC833DRAFT_590777 [Globomyces pollinis-pini]
MTAIFDLRIENFTFAILSGFLVVCSSNYVILTTDIIITHISNILCCCQFGFFLLYQDPYELNANTKLTYYIVAQTAGAISDVLLLYLLMKLTKLYNTKQILIIQKISWVTWVTGSISAIWCATAACFYAYGYINQIAISFSAEWLLLTYDSIFNSHILFATILHLYLIFQETRHRKQPKEVFALLFLRSAKTAIYEFILVLFYMLAAFPPLNEIPAIGQKITNIIYISIKLQVYMLFLTRIKN